MTVINSDDEKRKKILAMLFGAFGKADDADRLAIYGKMLEDMPVVLLSKAVKKLIFEKTFLPSVAEIVTSAKSIAVEVNAANRLPDWQEVWAEIEAAVQSSAPAKFSHPIIALAVKTYGMTNLKTCSIEMWSAAHAQMRRIYDDLCRRYSEKEMNAYVIGDTRKEIEAALERAKAGLVLLNVSVQAPPEVDKNYLTRRNEYFETRKERIESCPYDKITTKMPPNVNVQNELF